MLLTVLCGPPASGKSSWAAQNAGNAVVLSADAFRRNQNARMMNQLVGIMMIAPNHLRAGRDVIIDATSASIEHRHVWLDIARRHRADTHLIVLTTPLDVCLNRNASRGRQAAPTHVVIRQHATIASATFDNEGWNKVSYL